jgi:hypothetical protein
MLAEGVKRVVPEPLKPTFSLSVQARLQTLESFVADVRLLGR